MGEINDTQEPAVVALYRLSLEHRQKLIAILMTSGVAIAIPEAVEFGKALIERDIRQIELNMKEKNLEAENEAKKRESDLASLEFRHKAVSEYSAYGLSQDIEMRIRLAHYFSHLSDDDVQKKWMEYYLALREARNRDLAELEIVNKSIDELEAQKQPDVLALKQAYRKKTLLEAGFNPVAIGGSTTLLVSPETPPSNEGMTVIPDSRLLELFGNAGTLASSVVECGTLSNQLLNSQIRTATLNGQQITLLGPALDSFLRVVDQIGHTSPKTLERMKVISSLCVRSRRDGSTLTKHSYGIAIDIVFDGSPNQRTEVGDYTAIARAFVAEGWIWGGAWSGGAQETPHFELSQEKLAALISSGQIAVK
jgi:hypothetical protein